MTVKEAVLAALKEVILPKLHGLRRDLADLKTDLALTNQRGDNIN